MGGVNAALVSLCVRVAPSATFAPLPPKHKKRHPGKRGAMKKSYLDHQAGLNDRVRPRHQERQSELPADRCHECPRAVWRC